MNVRSLSGLCFSLASNIVNAGTVIHHIYLEAWLQFGNKQGNGGKVHLVFGETGEIRIDKKDQSPSEIFRKVESVLTKLDGSIVKFTLEFFKEKVD